MRSIIIAFAYTLLSTCFEERIFEVSYRAEHMFDYVLCKIIQCVLLSLFLEFAARVIRDKENVAERKIAIYAGIYLLLIGVYYLRIGQYGLWGDALDVYNSATHYEDSSVWFNYYTGYYYMISMMSVPVKYLSPVITKVLLQSLIVGYIVYRMRRQTGSKCSYFVYLFFFHSYTLSMALSVERLAIYGIIYIFFAAKIFFDYLEKKPLSYAELAGLALLGSILAFWRSEGIYLFVFLYVLIFLSYAKRGIMAKGKRIFICAFIAVAQILVFIPQSIDTIGADDSYVIRRMEPFYSYTFSNMCREGLDMEKNSLYIEEVRRYMNLEAVFKMNEEMGRDAYFDVYIHNYENAVYEVSTTEYLTFTKAVQNIIIHNPLLFLKERWQAFLYTSSVYVPEQFSVGGLIRYLSYQIYIPMLLCAAMLIWALVRREKVVLVLLLGVLCSIGITFLLAPAAFVKYYYVPYLIGYLGAIYACAALVGKFGRRIR